MRLSPVFACALLGAMTSACAADSAAAPSTTSVPASTPAATAVDEGHSLLLNNGLVALRIAKQGAGTNTGAPARNGEGLNILYREDDGSWTEFSNQQRALYFDEGGDALYPVDAGPATIVSSGPDLAEVMWTGEPGDVHTNRRTGTQVTFPFHTEMHAVMMRGDRGFYLYVVYKHDASMPRGSIGETRFVLSGAAGPTLFTNHIVDDDRMFAYPTADNPALGSQIQDVTTLHADGSIYTKYNNSTYFFDHHVHGMAGPHYGFWMITPSNEYMGGGPFKQDLTVHTGNTLLSMFVGGHFGTQGISFADGEVWSKVYGPVYVYLNKGDSLNALWEDAKQRSAAEYAKWPYTWLKNPDYPLERGTVTGQVALSSGAAFPVAKMLQDDGDHFSMLDGGNGTWAILSPMNEDWSQVLKGYDFWSQVDAAGHFSIRNVRPGTYRLSFVGGNQFEPFNQDNVVVNAGANDVGNVTWPVITHGRQLWQIGIADRLTFNFKNGDNYRHYENFINYLKDFPNDVTFVVGQSQESKDWNFVQYAIYNKKPYWTIQFDQPGPALSGRATLTLGVASADPHTTGATNSNSFGGARTDLDVKVNGQLVDTVRLAKTGTAGYRSGSSDSNYNVVYVTFDAALLKPGVNEITLGFERAQSAPADSPYLQALQKIRAGTGQEPKASGAGGPSLTREDPLLNMGPPEQMMYDAIRLEVDPNAAPPAPAASATPAPATAAN
jgi:rhamnogalacturonan endolyase